MLLVVACAALSGACARQPQLSKPSVEEGVTPIEVSGNCTAELVDGGEVLRVSGTCSLIDGTNGIVCVLNADGSTVDKRKFVKESEDLSFDFDVTGEWSDTVYGFISFDTQQCDRQPDEVTELYGKRFQNLEGPDVIWDSKGVIAVFQSEAVKLQKTQS